MVRLQLSNLTMVKDGRQQGKRRVRTALLHVIRKSPTPSEKRLTAILKSILGFEPGLLGQNAITLLLAPPPRVWFQ